MNVQNLGCQGLFACFDSLTLSVTLLIIGYRVIIGGEILLDGSLMSKVLVTKNEITYTESRKYVVNMFHGLPGTLMKPHHQIYIDDIDQI